MVNAFRGHVPLFRDLPRVRQFRDRVGEGLLRQAQRKGLPTGSLDQASSFEPGGRQRVVVDMGEDLEETLFDPQSPERDP